MKNLACVYDKGDNIFQIKWEGKTKFKEVEEAWSKLLDDFNLEGSEYHFLIDSSDVFFDETTDQCLAFAAFCDSRLDIFSNSKMAVVATTPHATARLFYIVKKLKMVKMRIFSTPNAAKEWLVS